MAVYDRGKGDDPDLSPKGERAFSTRDWTYLPTRARACLYSAVKIAKNMHAARKPSASQSVDRTTSSYT